jgi:hypothetical protein
VFDSVGMGILQSVTLCGGLYTAEIYSMGERGHTAEFDSVRRGHAALYLTLWEKVHLSEL